MSHTNKKHDTRLLLSKTEFDHQISAWSGFHDQITTQSSYGTWFAAPLQAHEIFYVSKTPFIDYLVIRKFVSRGGVRFEQQSILLTNSCTSAVHQLTMTKFVRGLCANYWYLVMQWLGGLLTNFVMDNKRAPLFKHKKPNTGLFC